jgi:amino acid adenylation domain-containing protein
MVSRYADRLAVKTKNHTFTYDQLNKTSNRVAHAILEQRAERNEPVALLLEQSTQEITAILGLLKAGKIYVPLDPSYPRERLTYLMDDSQTGLIVTNNRNVSLASDLARKGIHLLNIDELDLRLSIETPCLTISPDSLAYIQYTSGSTGMPKGATQNHRNTLHDIMNYTNAIHICADDRLSLLTSGTGQAMKHIFAAMLNGAALFPFPLKEEGVGKLANWLIQEEITIYRSAAMVFRHFASTLTGLEEFPKLRLIRLASETVSKRDVDLYKKHFSPDCILVNGLSSGEAINFRKYFIDKRTCIITNTVPVGYAVQGKRVLLLDDSGEEVGFNYVGEITVKSRYLSPGYWRWPELTRVAFLSDPTGSSERVYRTGDLGRMLPDGCVELVGRKDFRVKIRGYSVELSEIDVALLDHPAIKEAVVVAQQEVSSGKQLVAYVVPAKRAPNVSELRSFLKEKFPDYMIPSAFVMLDALPLLPNGKVDRKALPVPPGSRPELDNSYVAPRTTVEKELSQIWAEVLSLDEIGIHDNFLDLGGDSLLATQVISRVINAFRVELSVKTLFKSPTVVDMGVVITENMAKKGGDGELAHMLDELESLSDEEARKRFADKESKGHLEK